MKDDLKTARQFVALSDRVAKELRAKEWLEKNDGDQIGAFGYFTQNEAFQVVIPRRVLKAHVQANIRRLRAEIAAL